MAALACVEAIAVAVMEEAYANKKAAAVTRAMRMRTLLLDIFVVVAAAVVANAETKRGRVAESNGSLFFIDLRRVGFFGFFLFGFLFGRKGCLVI